MGSLSVFLTVVGKLNDPGFHACKRLADYASESLDGITCEVISLLPTDYELLLQRFKADHPDVFGTVTGNVCCFEGSPSHPATLIGGKAALMDWAKSSLAYTDKTNSMLYERMAKQHMRSVMAESKHTYTYFDIAIGGAVEGKVLIELFDDIAPATCKNFLALCTGSDGGCYKNTPFHRVVKNGWVQGGDVKGGKGSAGRAADGSSCIADETFAMKHSSMGILSMASSGPHTGASQFFITLEALPWLDGKKVAFGRVIDGMRIIKLMAKLDLVNERPVDEVTISDCGVYTLEPPPPPPPPPPP